MPLRGEIVSELLRASVAAARRVAAEIEVLEAQGMGRAEARRLARERVRAMGVRGLAPVPSAGSLRFERRCYIELSFDSRQLKTIRRYIRLNPARRLWKLAHPDRFVCHQNIRHEILDPARRWQGLGDLTLLGSPFLFHVRLTLKKSVAEHEEAIAEIVAKAKRGMVPVSGFISPGEVEHRVLLHDVVNGTTRTMTYECWATNLIVSRTDLPLKQQFPTKYAEVKNVTIASGASSICADLFKDCIALETVTLPSGIVAIGKGAFAGCGNVVSINVPRLEDWMLTSIVDDADDPVRNGAALLVDGEPLAGDTARIFSR